MQWTGHLEQDAAITSLEKRLWDSADRFRADSSLKAQQHSSPILGLIFLRFAEVRYATQCRILSGISASSGRGRRVAEPTTRMTR